MLAGLVLKIWYTFEARRPFANAEAAPLFPLGHSDLTVGLVTLRILIGCGGSGTDACERTRPLAPGRRSVRSPPI